jgi:hypothetical protein
MEYFEIPAANIDRDGICSDNDCPCGFPGAGIPHRYGHMNISQDIATTMGDSHITAFLGRLAIV